EKRAKELATESYQRLLHDLHNPVAALRTLIKVAAMPTLSADDRKEASDRIPYLAEQILNQVSAAKENINFEAKILKEEDIRECVKNALEQTNLASPRFGSVTVESAIPSEP